MIFTEMLVVIDERKGWDKGGTRLLRSYGLVPFFLFFPAREREYCNAWVGWVLAALAVALAGVRAAPVVGGCDHNLVAAGTHCVCKPEIALASSCDWAQTPPARLERKTVQDPENVTRPVRPEERHRARLSSGRLHNQTIFIYLLHPTRLPCLVLPDGRRSRARPQRARRGGQVA